MAFAHKQARKINNVKDITTMLKRADLSYGKQGRYRFVRSASKALRYLQIQVKG